MTHALTKPVAEMLEILPPALYAPASPPHPSLSRLRCIFFFNYPSATVEKYHARGETWWVMNLRELSYDMDKDYSRATSRLAIPELINEINVLQNPKQAAKRFGIMALDPDLSREPMEEDNQ